MLLQNSVQENEMYPPVMPCHPASLLQCNRFLPHRQIFLQGFSFHELPAMPCILQQNLHRLQASVPLLSQLLQWWHEQYVLPDIKIQPSAKTIACAFPSELHSPTDSQEWEDHDKIESSLCTYSK